MKGLNITILQPKSHLDTISSYCILHERELSDSIGGRFANKMLLNLAFIEFGIKWDEHQEKQQTNHLKQVGTKSYKEYWDKEFKEI